ncbi:hypothetical protein LTR84_003170 [Exophiala bonariae]|uniref:Uncharacterized protein n=1 Tax=Exophiala bonariae TaxID=1690606 RepID=A0AAV9N8C9_9EURO|nr:hypothetical protein LTR84_003170 [Exophiala bonariae]
MPATPTNVASYVSSVETAPLTMRAWQASQRYSPYPHMNQRLNYVQVAPRYSPSSAMHCPTVPSNVEYGSYGGSAQNVDWTRGSYAAQYPTYGEEEVTSPYSNLPPPYILPHTDPMNARNGYYGIPNGVRPQPGAIWPEQQQALIPQSSNLPATSYTQSTDAPQHFQSLGIATNLPPDRILPDPIRAPNDMAATAQPTVDSLNVTDQDQRTSACWSNGVSTSSAHVVSHVESDSGRCQSSDQRATSYRMQELAYDHLTMSDALSSTPISSGLTTGVIEPQPLAPSITTQGHHSQLSSQRTISHESLRSTPEIPSVTYGYTSAMAGRTSQLSSTSDRVSSALLYCHPLTVVPRRESGSEDCSTDCSSCPTDSTRCSITSMSNASSGY